MPHLLILSNALGHSLKNLSNEEINMKKWWLRWYIWVPIWSSDCCTEVDTSLIWVLFICGNVIVFVCNAWIQSVLSVGFAELAWWSVVCCGIYTVIQFLSFGCLQFCFGGIYRGKFGLGHLFGSIVIIFRVLLCVFVFDDMLFCLAAGTWLRWHLQCLVANCWYRWFLYLY